MRNSLRQEEVVVVTGASAGVGRAVVRRFAQDGAHIGLIARGLDGLEAARNDVEAMGGKAIICQTDVSDPQAVERAAEKVVDEFGPIDIWINNATTSVFSPIKETKAEEFKRVTEVTYLGTVYGTQAALKRMLPRDRGRDCSSRQCARISRDSTAIGLLRGEQQIYRGWALLGVVVAGALVSTLVLAVMVRKERKAFVFALIAFLCIAGTQLVFWTYTYPANQATNNWTMLPENWTELRRQWEYSHATSASLNLMALVTMILSVLARGEPK